MNLYGNHMLSPSSLRFKNNGVLTRNGEVKSESDHLLYFLKATWWHSFVACVGFWKSTLSHLPSWVWEIHFTSHLIITLRQRDLWSYVESNVAKLQSRVADMFKRSPICSSLPLIHCLNFFLGPGSLYSTTSFVSCRWWGIPYVPPLTNHFLSTSAHYIGRRSRTSLPVP